MDMSKIKRALEATQEKLKVAEIHSEYLTDQMIDLKVRLDSWGLTEKIYRQNFENQNKNLVYKMQEIQNYKCPTYESWPLERWIRTNRIGDWFANYLVEGINMLLDSSEKVKAFRLLKKVAKHAWMFAIAGLGKIDGETEAVTCVENLEKPGWYKCIKSNLINNSTFAAGNSVVFDSKLKVYDLELGKDLAIFKPTDDGIPNYIKIWPYLGAVIYYSRQKNRNLSYLSLIPNCNTGDPAQDNVIAKHCSDPDKYGSANTTDAQQTTNINNVSALNSNPLKFITPPQEIKEFYEVMKDNKAMSDQELADFIGMPIKSNEDKDLNADANSQKTNQEYINKQIINEFLCFIIEASNSGLVAWAAKEDEQKSDENIENTETDACSD